MPLALHFSTAIAVPVDAGPDSAEVSGSMTVIAMMRCRALAEHTAPFLQALSAAPVDVLAGLIAAYTRMLAADSSEVDVV